MTLEYVNRAREVHQISKLVEAEAAAFRDPSATVEYIGPISSSTMPSTYVQTALSVTDGESRTATLKLCVHPGIEHEDIRLAVRYLLHNCVNVFYAFPEDTLAECNFDTDIFEVTSIIEINSFKNIVDMYKVRNNKCVDSRNISKYRIDIDKFSVVGMLYEAIAWGKEF